MAAIGALTVSEFAEVIRRFTEPPPPYISGARVPVQPIAPTLGGFADPADYRKWAQST